MAGVAIPSIGVAMEEALLVKWHKQPGDDVAANEPVAEIETDKVTMDLESPVAGLLGQHLFEAGAIVPVGTVIVEVVAVGDAVAPAPPAAAHPQLAGDAVAPPVPAPVAAVAEPSAADGAPAAPAEPACTQARAGAASAGDFAAGRALPRVDRRQGERVLAADSPFRGHAGRSMPERC